MHGSSSGWLSQPTWLQSPLRFIPYAPDVWCPLLRSADLRPGSVRSTALAGRKLAVFRDQAGAIGAVLDQCPHRGVELSMGRVCIGAIQCAYHGWKVDPSGSVVDVPGTGRPVAAPGIEAFEVRERYGLIWVFLGERTGAASTPLPELGPFGEGGGVDILVHKEVRAHWTLVLDNGLDLYHHRLHRDIPIFFRILSLEDYGSDGSSFRVHYKAVMSDAWGRRRPGDLRIRAQDSLFTLDLNGFPVIHSVSTPRTADGRQLTQWWFIACPATPFLRCLHTAMLPVLRHHISRGFDQDVRVLESEQRAWDRGLRGQNELNPVVLAAHRHFCARVVDFARAKKMGENESTRMVPCTALLDEVESGAVAVVLYGNDDFTLIDPVQLPARLAGRSQVPVARYVNVVVVCTD